MLNSRPVAILALILMLTFGLSSVCFAVPAHVLIPVSGDTPGGCHGHHGPMRPPVHSCCNAAHQFPAATPIAPLPAVLDSVGPCVTAPVDTQPRAVGPAAANDSSPPSVTVLRI